MRTKRVNRYYCDHCGKGNLQKAAMARHESRCVSNPNRQCGFCRLMERDQPRLELLVSGLCNAGIKWLAMAAQDCPGCMLSAIKQSKITGPGAIFGFDDPLYIECLQWEFKTAQNEFWKEYNDAKMQEEPLMYY